MAASLLAMPAWGRVSTKSDSCTRAWQAKRQFWGRPRSF